MTPIQHYRANLDLIEHIKQATNTHITFDTNDISTLHAELNKGTDTQHEFHYTIHNYDHDAKLESALTVLCNKLLILDLTATILEYAQDYDSLTYKRSHHWLYITLSDSYPVTMNTNDRDCEVQEFAYRRAMYTTTVGLFEQDMMVTPASLSIYQMQMLVVTTLRAACIKHVHLS